MPKLNVRTVETLSKAGVYNDGDGLYLRLSRKGVGSWFLRTMVQGKKTDIGLGSLRTVSLAEARREAAEKRAVAREGGDPRAQPSLVPTFREAAQLV